MAKPIKMFCGKWGSGPLQEERKIASGSNSNYVYFILFQFGMETVIIFCIVSHKTIVDNDKWNSSKLVLCEHNMNSK